MMTAIGGIHTAIEDTTGMAITIVAIGTETTAMMTGMTTGDGADAVIAAAIVTGTITRGVTIRI